MDCWRPLAGSRACWRMHRIRTCWARELSVHLTEWSRVIWPPSLASQCLHAITLLQPLASCLASRPVLQIFISAVSSVTVAIAFCADLLCQRNRAATFGLIMACFRWACQQLRKLTGAHGLVWSDALKRNRLVPSVAPPLAAPEAPSGGRVKPCSISSRRCAHLLMPRSDACLHVPLLPLPVQHRRFRGPRHGRRAGPPDRLPGGAGHGSRLRSLYAADPPRVTVRRCTRCGERLLPTACLTG